MKPNQIKVAFENKIQEANNNFNMILPDIEIRFDLTGRTAGQAIFEMITDGT